jgi:hypothetical protein
MEPSSVSLEFRIDENVEEIDSSNTFNKRLRSDSGKIFAEEQCKENGVDAEGSDEESNEHSEGEEEEEEEEEEGNFVDSAPDKNRASEKVSSGGNASASTTRRKIRAPKKKGKANNVISRDDVEVVSVNSFPLETPFDRKSKSLVWAVSSPSEVMLSLKEPLKRGKITKGKICLICLELNKKDICYSSDSGNCSKHFRSHANKASTIESCCRVQELIGVKIVFKSADEVALTEEKNGMDRFLSKSPALSLHDLCDKSIIEFVLSHGLSLNILQSEAFRNMVRYLRKLPSSANADIGKEKERELILEAHDSYMNDVSTLLASNETVG